ncbi:MAG: hypothetical protein AB7E79_11535 [Rhodospirillaceae bacterium]
MPLSKISTTTAAIGALCAGAFAALPTAANALERRSYAMAWFTAAMNSSDNDCPGGVHPPIQEQYHKNLLDLGYPPAEAAKLIEAYVAGDDNEQVSDIMLMRGRIDGKPVNGYAHPGAVVDPQLTTVIAKEGFGFNLDGKDGPLNFTDPLTKETGVDNQLSRALGCSNPFRGTYNVRPGLWLFRWSTMRDTTPAWLMTLEGEDLDKDGPITITFDRAMEHLIFNGDGEARPDITYRADTDPRNHTVLKGEIKDGIIRITEHGKMQLMQDILGGGQLVLDKVHMRLTRTASGNLDGFLAGYQPWEHLYFEIAQGGPASEDMSTGELPGKWHAMRKMADYDPDPKTGQNRAISATWRVEFVPVFVARMKNGEFVVENQN